MGDPHDQPQETPGVLTMAITTADVLIVGAGMAGASVASELVKARQVVLLEREDHPGYHSTGRSAAMYVKNYGNPPVRSLTAASFDLLYQPPRDFADQPLLKPRGVMYVASRGQEAALAALAELEGTEPLTVAEAKRRVPLLREDRVVGALMEAAAMELDVHGLYQGYLRRFRQLGGRLHCRAGVQSLARSGDNWRVATGAGEFEAPILVNAAGAWADELAVLAGGRALDLTPRRRTAAIIAPPAAVAVGDWPMVIGAAEDVYFRPEVGKLLLSPADATPVPPCDVQPEEWDVAVAVQRLEELLEMEVRRVEHRWAGLRTFAPDGSPVVGWDPQLDGFFWLAGQGGYGIQMAPALARLAAALVMGENLPVDLTGLDRAAVDPRRLAIGA